MMTASLDGTAAAARTVLCPRCGLPCSLMPLRRPGAYRLVDPDGHGHTAVCIAGAQIERPAVRYRPMPSVRDTPVQPARPLAVMARQA